MFVLNRIASNPDGDTDSMLANNLSFLANWVNFIFSPGVC